MLELMPARETFTPPIAFPAVKRSQPECDTWECSRPSKSSSIELASILKRTRLLLPSFRSQSQLQPVNPYHSSAGRYPYFFPIDRQTLSGFIPPVQVGCDNDAAATQTPACKH